MTSLFALRTVFFSGEVFAGSLLLMALAWLVATQRSAAVRHLVWVSAFGAVLLLPVLIFILPSPLRILLPAPEQVPLQALNIAAQSALTAPATNGLPVDPETIGLLLAALSLVGACAIGLRLATAAVCLAALKRRSRPFALPPEDLPRITATRRECELRLSDSENGPITWGVFRPVILLPRTAIFWPRERMSAVLLHELAHIRRRDSLAQALSHFVCALYWPNPLVWMAARRMRREAEIAADDAAIVSGLKPSRYAGELLQLAHEFQLRRPAFSLSLFMAEQSALEARVESVLAPDASRTGVSTSDAIKACGVGAAAAMVIAFACPSLAQASVTSAPPTSNIESAPLAPVAPPAPPAPPAPEAPAASDAPAPPAAPPPDTMRTGHPHWHSLTRDEREKIHAAILRAKLEAREAIAKTRPQIERALAEARSGEEAMRAVREAQPEIDASVARATEEAHEALEKAKPEIAQAMADAKISEHAVEAPRDVETVIGVVDAKIGEHAVEAPRDVEPVMRAKYDIGKLQAEVDRALVHARDEIAKAHIDEQIRARVDEALESAKLRLDEEHARGQVTNDESQDGDR